MNLDINAIQRLSNDDIQNRLEGFIQAERKNVSLFIAHLSIVAKRKLHLAMGYKSLFDYCTTHLNLSEGSAYRRIQVAKICNDFPNILKALSQNQISLTVASQLAPHLKEENFNQLIQDCTGKSKREVEVYLVGLKPKKLVTSGIKRKTLNRIDSSQDLALELDVVPQEQKSEIEAAQKEIFNFRFSADEKLKGKLERLAEVLGIDNPQGHLDEVIDKALEIALDKKDPQRKLERRKKRQEKKKCQDKVNVQNKITERQVLYKTKERSRYIPAEIREIVLERANYQCEYRCETGTRCCQRTHLEMDHIIPYAFGGSNDPENLRALCKSHNLFEAQKYFPLIPVKHP